MGVLLPLGLLIMAIVSAAAVAYGTSPDLGQYSHGVEAILLARRLQWPMVALSLLFSLGLLLLIVSGRRRAWYLLGLAPVLALFVHRFGPRDDQFIVLDGPQFVAADHASFLRDDDFVVGLIFESRPYAYPYASLFTTPVILQQDHDQRMILLWNAFANRAMAFHIARDLHARDLEIVSMPRNAMILYDARLGRFINGLTGRTPDDQEVRGIKARLATAKMTWARWKRQHPQTEAMLPPDSTTRMPAPRAPIRPQFKMPPAPLMDVPVEARVAMISTPRPAAILSDDLTNEPLNLRINDTPLLIFRDRQDGIARAFDRHVDDDLTPQFRLNTDPRRKEAVFIDADTNTGWNERGIATDPPPRKAKKLTPFFVEDDLYWGVMKTWYPDLDLLHPDLAPPPASAPAPAAGPAAPSAARPSRRRAR